MAGLLLTKVVPVFPEEAQRQGVNGSVLLYAVIGPDGLVKEAHVISGPELLRPSYLTAVTQWTYRPYLVNGVPAPVETTIILHIQNSSASSQPQAH